MLSGSSNLLLLRRLWLHLSDRRRIQFGMLLILMLLASVTEIISIGALLPFLAVLSDPNRVFDNPSADFFISTLGISSPGELLFPLTVIFGLAAVLAGSLRLLLTWASTRLTFAAGADLSLSIYRRTLYQPYSVHVMRNSSEVINGIVNKTSGVIYGVIGPALSLASSTLILIAILSILLFLEPIISTIAFIGFGSIYGVIIWITGTQKIKNSKMISHESTQVIKSLQEGLGGIRDVLIDGSQATHCQIYQSADKPLRAAQGSNQFIAQAPRYGVEALGMVLIASLAYTLTKRSDGVGEAIPVLGALALGTQRMLPAMQLAYASWTSIEGGRVSFQDTLDLLDQPLLSEFDQLTKPLEFGQQISLENLSFRYSLSTPWILKNLNLSIVK